MSLLAGVVSFLQRERVPHALIGAAALNAHGVNRASFDIDLLSVEPRLLRADTWAAMKTPSLNLEIHTGDIEDDLAGTVRLNERDDMVDVVVGKHRWELELIEKAAPVTVNGVSVPVVSAVGLVLLKLHAASARDAWDVQALLEATLEANALKAEVEQWLPRLPKRARDLWIRVISGATLTD
jgi:predicted nucleotidyltransferase